jgi:AAA+ ATPase superfamily predicted ATPase
MKNPFYYSSGSGIEQDDFCGQQREIEELRTDIESGMNTLVYAARRFGKTALFHEILWREKIGQEGILS